MNQVFDVAIIGGGINGCGCAADVALRGLSVVLFEQDDLASKTSSSSTKLIHGGLRYLEYYEFALVKKALDERQTLLNLAPYLIRPQSFILPYQKHMRPSWLLRLGLFFYDHLSRKNRLPKCKSIKRTNKNNFFKPLINSLKRGFMFYDASTDDARLTLINAIQAKNHGARIRTHSRVTEVNVVNNLWSLTISPKQGSSYRVQAKTVINAAGPWVKTIAALTATHITHDLTLVKGSHILVPQLYEGNHAYFLQNDDKRVVFVIPYHGMSMIGTTDVPFSSSLDEIHISEEEVDYLVSLVNAYFKIKISPNDIVSSWSGIRPLLADSGKDAKSLSRDYYFEFTKSPAPIVTLFGGKITTYRQLAEDAINQLAPIFPKMHASATKSTPLPGTTLGSMTFENYATYAKEKYHWLDTTLLQRYLNTYGTRMDEFLHHCTSINNLGRHFGASLYQVEVDYLIKEEWARNADDILNRRTKLGLRIKAKEKQALIDYLAEIEPVFN